MVNHEASHIPNPSEQALEVAAEVFDLRNRALFDRVGEEGMRALADQAAEQRLLGHLEGELAPEQTALDALLRGQEIERMSQTLFEGRSFSELTPVEIGVVVATTKADREQSKPVELSAGTSESPLTRCLCTQ